MEGPHQRTQSGKLRKPSKRSKSDSSIKLPSERTTVFTGIESTISLNIEDSDESYEV